MEPTIDPSNEKEVPVVIWTDGDYQEENERKLAIISNGQLTGTSKESIVDEVKFVDSKGRIFGVNRSDSFSSHSSTTTASSSSSSTKSRPKKKHKVPDGGWGWVVVFASFVISMIADGISFSFGLLYIEFLNYFGESKSKTSWIGSLFMAVPLLTGPIMSALVDRYGCRSMTMVGGFISGLGFVIASFGNSIEWEFIFFGVVAGIGLGLCYVTAVVSIAYWFDKYRTLAIGLGACGTGVGTFVYAPLTQFLIEEYGWRGTVLLLAGTFFNMCVCGALMRDPDWMIEEHNKHGSLKNTSSCSTIRESIADPSFIQTLKISNSLDCLSANMKTGKKRLTDDSETSSANKDDSLPSVRSEVNLPTFIKKKDQVPPEVFEQMTANKAMFNVLLENYPSLLRCKDLPLAKTNEPTALTLSENFEEMPEKTIGSDTILPPGENVISRRSKKSTVKCATFGKDSGQHYLKDIRIHRNSVMYRGAMLNIPRYRLRASSCPDIFRNSMTTIAKENEEKWYADALELLKTMFDFSMFVELHFLLMSLATIILFIWLIVPYFYLAEHVTRYGYTEVEASILLSIIGVTNCIGMVSLGWAGDQPWMNVTKTYAVCLTLCGFTCIFMPLTTDKYNLLATLSALFGLFFASNYSFTPSIVVQLISLERFTTAYGLILLCQGIGCLVGPPLAGLIFDLMGEWDLSFYLAGGWIIFSAILTILIQYTKNRRIWGSGQLEVEKVQNMEL